MSVRHISFNGSWVYQTHKIKLSSDFFFITSEKPNQKTLSYSIVLYIVNNLSSYSRQKSEINNLLLTLFAPHIQSIITSCRSSILIICSVPFLTFILATPPVFLHTFASPQLSLNTQYIMYIVFFSRLVYLNFLCLGSLHTKNSYSLELKSTIIFFLKKLYHQISTSQPLEYHMFSLLQLSINLFFFPSAGIYISQRKFHKHRTYLCMV